MPRYRLAIMEHPEKGLPAPHFRQHRDFEAEDDTAAIREASKLYNRLAGFVRVDSFVLYEGGRVVHEFVGAAR